MTKSRKLAEAFYKKGSTAIQRAIAYSGYRKYLYAIFVCRR